jgi:predicted permease
MTPWLARWLRRDRLDRDLDDEIGFHVEAATRVRIAKGISPAEARRQALAEFGGTQPIKEATRDARGGRWLDDVAMDVRYGLRALRNQPGFAAVAVLTLTLGIGANTTIFSIVNAVLLRPLPVSKPGQLVLFSGDVSQGTVTGSPFPEDTWTHFSTEVYEFLRAELQPIVSVAAFESGDYRGSLRMPGRSDETNLQAETKFVSGNYFDVMGVTPALGRTLTLDDDRPDAARVAVASDRFWRSRLDADPLAVGRTVTIDNIPVTIVGVTPRAFFGERVRHAPDLWVPISTRDAAVRDRHDYYWLSLIGRLQDRQTIRSAESATTEALRQFLTGQTASPVSVELRQRINAVRVEMASGANGISLVREQNTRLLVLLLASVGVILLTACANVGTLFLARGVSRERETAVRRALGASRPRLVRQWLTESALIGGTGALCGIGLSAFVSPALLPKFVPSSVPIAATIDWSVLAFTTGITLVACLLFGLAPALQASRVDPVGSLRVAGRGSRRRRVLGIAEPFVVAQIALSLVLVIAATLLVRTLLNLEEAPLGFDQDRVLLTAINPRTAGYTAAEVGALYRRIYDRVRTLPGVESATFARYSPFSGSSSTVGSKVEGYEPSAGERVRFEWIPVGPNYPQTLGMPILEGRAIGIDDAAGAPLVAMVNEAFVTHFFPSRSPLGHHFSTSGSYEIIGVVKDAQYHGAREKINPTVFVSMLQETTGRALDCEIELRTRGDAATLANPARKEIAGVDARVTVTRTRTLREQVLATFDAERTAAGFIVSFAAIALLVASLGLYGTVSHGLARRTNEIGVRMALGAARADVLQLVARETIVRLAAGLLIGVVLSQAAGQALASQLFGVTSHDLLSLGLAAAVLAAVVALATLRPALRAMRIDPVRALRAE